MIVKVCGLAHNEDLISLSQYRPDMVGFVFSDRSPRYAAGKIDPELCALLSRSVPAMKKVGVFVDADADEVFRTIEQYHLDVVQLHGEEGVGYCATLAEQVDVIKAFSVSEEFDFSRCDDYNDACRYFLFDTAGKAPGGNGIQFDWELLQKYTGATPFLLSGGIGPQDILKLFAYQHQSFAGADVNSRFELYPGKKNVDLLRPFITTLKQPAHEFRSF